MNAFDQIVSGGAQGGAAEQFCPGRLWSLWEIMEKTDITNLLNIAKECGRITSFVSNTPQSFSIGEETKVTYQQQLSLVQNDFLKMEFPSCAAQIQRIFARLNGELDSKTISSMLEELFNRLIDDAASRYFVVVRSENVHLMKPPKPPFGLAFQSKYPSAQFELEETMKCMALERSTAAVFHMMRMMEIAIRAVSRCLQIPDPVKPAEKNWGKILDKIWKEGIEKKWPTANDRAIGDGATFEALHASLDAVKNPWRNSTMHVDNKYLPDESHDIYAAVRGFMKKLADRCDENGDPKA
jgi:hypothetical protein